MAEPNLEGILEDEYKRLWRNEGGSKLTGLIELLQPATTSIPTPSPSPSQPAGGTSILSEIFPAAGAPPTNTSSSLPPGPSSQSDTPSMAGKIGKTALKLFTSGLGVMPLVSGLAGLFGGGEQQAPASLLKYAMPRPIQLTAANSRDGGALSFADRNQDGIARSFGENTSQQAHANASAAQIVVNVQAMDSRSFLDHSQEIAQAVREAMLNMHALNDVVNEL